MQGEVEAALRTVLRLDVAPALTVAGRTDAGVHARGQVCHLDLDAQVWAAAGTAVGSRGRTPADGPSEPGAGPGRAARARPPGEPTSGERLVRQLAGVLPPDVRVHRIQCAPDGFDARFGALGRRYAYRLVDDPAAADPLLRSHVLAHPRRLDVGAMDAASAPLVGEHDFAAYCRRRQGATTVRTLLRLRCTRNRDGLVVVDVEADAFCHQMVRSIVGALVAVGEGRRSPAWPATLLSARAREPAVTVMPAVGLTLEEVRYPPADQLAVRAAVTRSVRAPRQSAPALHRDP